MNQNENNQHQQEVNDHIHVEHEHRSQWKSVHHSWIFWIFMLLTLAAILYYIFSLNFSLAPQKQLEQSSENSSTT